MLDSGSSSGRTADFDSANGGSSPSPETNRLIEQRARQIADTVLKEWRSTLRMAVSNLDVHFAAHPQESGAREYAMQLLERLSK